VWNAGKTFKIEPIEPIEPLGAEGQLPSALREAG
jgi:hypothetical protein